MRYLVAVAFMLVTAAVPAHARGTTAGPFSGSAIVPPMTGTTVPPLNGTIAPPFTRPKGRDFGNVGYYEGPTVDTEAARGSGADFIKPGPALSKKPAELPLCHEVTSFGVVVERGTGCSSIAH